MKVLLLGWALLLSSCTAISPELIQALAQDNASFCAIGDIRGGAGAIAPAAPSGGYGQSTLGFCRSNRPNAKVTLAPDGSISIEHKAGE